MSSAAISPHIPDFDLITYYAEQQQSFASAISPWTKLIFLIFLITAVTIVKDFIILSIIFLGIFILYASAGLPVDKLIGWYTLPVIFVLSLVIILIWSEPGRPVFSAEIFGFTLTLTSTGITLLFTLILKALISVTYSLFFLMTTRYQYFAGMISVIFPDPLDQIFLMAYRFLFLTLTMTSSLLKSIKSRGGGLSHSIRTQGRLFAGIFALVFIRSFEQGERVQRAMAARGFSGGYTTYGNVPRPVITEYMVLGIAGVSVAALAILSFSGVST